MTWILRSILSKTQQSTLEHLGAFVGDVWSKGDPLNPWYTLHNELHARQVEIIISDILGIEHINKKEFGSFLKPDQVFILIAAAWLHDIGMRLPPSDIEYSLSKQENLLIADWVRKHHHERSRQYVIAHATELRLSVEEASYIGELCWAHRRINRSTNKALTPVYPDLLFLGAVLRVADELDFTIKRAPQSLLAFDWNGMDDTSRWHWVKHYCILSAEPYHIRREGAGRDLRGLIYQLSLRLPSERFVAPFLNVVLRPITKALNDEMVDVILREKGITVRPDWFEHTLAPSNSSFPDSTTLEQRINDNIIIYPTLTQQQQERIDSFRNILPPPAVALLLQQCLQLVNYMHRHPELIDAVNERVNTYFTQVLSGCNAATLSTVYSSAKQDFYQLIRNESPHMDQISCGAIMNQSSLLFMTAYRLRIMSICNDKERITQITYLMEQLGRDAGEVAAWYYMHSDQSEIKDKTLRLMIEYSGAECYDAILSATKDTVASIRAVAAKALGRLWGPGALERLAEMATYDTENEVRVAAKRAFQQIDDSLPQISLLGKRALIVDTDDLIRKHLVDALMASGMDVLVDVNEDSILLELDNWKPDIVLITVSPSQAVPDSTATAEMGIVYSIKRTLASSSEQIPIIVLSQPEVYITEDVLIDLHAIHIHKPATVDNLVRVIDAVLANY